jgi:hypothetical protein
VLPNENAAAPAARIAAVRSITACFFMSFPPGLLETFCFTNFSDAF